MKQDPDFEITQPIPLESFAEVVTRGFDQAPHVRLDTTDVVQDSYDDHMTEAEFDRMIRANRPTVDIRPMNLRGGSR